jgi:prephenate dehydrogenase
LVEKVCAEKGIDNYELVDPEWAVGRSDITHFCVPTDKVKENMAHLLPYCREGAIISDQTSRKEPVADAFDEYVSASGFRLYLVPIHTLCDPSKLDDPVEGAKQFRLGIVKHVPLGDELGYREAYSRALELYSNMSDHVEEFDNWREHDETIANTQINTSRTNLAIASAFSNVGCFPGLNETYSGGFDVMKFALAMRTASQPGHIYKGIQLGSELGVDVMRHARTVEGELWSLVENGKLGEYRKRVLDAKERLFDGMNDPILRDEDIERFGALGVRSSNSDFSIVQWAVALAEANRDIFSDRRATTPLYDSLVALAARLFNTDAIDRAISAPFNDPSLISDDVVFHYQLQAWSEVILFDNPVGYDRLHGQMRSGLDDDLLLDQVRKSKEVVEVCRQRVSEVLD